MNVLVYSKKQCSFCVKAKALLDMKNIPYRESVIGEDILREDFMSIFPEQKSVPLIVIDGQKVGGYQELVEFLDNRPQFLSE